MSFGVLTGKTFLRRLSRKHSVQQASTESKFGWRMWDDLESWIDLKAKNTQTQYRGVLREFCQCLGIDRTRDGEELLKQVAAKEVLRFINICKARPAQGGRSALVCERVSLSTVKRKVIIMHSIYQQLQDMGAIVLNPWGKPKRELRAARGNDRRPHQLVPFEKVRELLDLDFGRSAEGIRDRALVAVAFGAGCRSNEILSLRVADVRTGEGGAPCLFVRSTKAQEAVTRYIPAWAAEHVHSCLHVRRIEGAKDTDPLFTSYKAGVATNVPIIDRTFRRLFARLLQRVGLEGEFSPHCARATVVTKLRADDVSPEDIMKLTGHRSTRMVLHYDKLRDSGAAKVAAKVKY